MTDQTIEKTEMSAAPKAATSKYSKVRFNRHQIKETVLEYAKSILFAICIALVFRSLFFEPYKIPSRSMVPTLEVGDFLFVSQYSYGYSRYSFPVDFSFIKGRIFYNEPTRGDIIVFKSPKGDGINYIKRLIGLPGDEIQIKRSVIHINGAPASRKHVGTYNYEVMPGQYQNYDVFEEVLDTGYTYKTLSVPSVDFHSNFPDTTSTFKVPEGHFFFMGDNRNHSVDSRFMPEEWSHNIGGYVPAENLIGKAQFLHWTRDFSFMNIITKFEFGRLFNRLSNAN
jgi:signal peptidase I